MGSVSYAEERHIACLAVQCASLLTKSVMQSIKHVSKKDSTPVTVADFAVQALLIGTLSRAFPADAFLGEESAAALRDDADLRQQVWDLVSSSKSVHVTGNKVADVVQPSSPEEMMDFIDRGGLGTGGRNGRTWIMDPIDGTATFIEGGQYAVAVALVENGNEVLGVIGCPNLTLDLANIESIPSDDKGCGFMVSAVRGDGGVLIQPISTGKLSSGEFIRSRRPQEQYLQSPLQQLNLNFVDSNLGEQYHMKNAAQLATDLCCASFPGTEVWSTQIRLIVIALGKTSANNVQVRIPPPISSGEEDPENYIWDYAGAHLILREAGGVVSDLNGHDLDFGAGRRLAGNWGLVATSHPMLHEKMLGRVRENLKL